VNSTLNVESTSSLQHAQRVAIDAEHAGERLDQFLTRLLPRIPRSRIFRLIRRGEVRVNGGRTKPERRLAAGDEVRVPPVRLENPAGVQEPSTPVKVAAPAGRLAQLKSAIIFQDERLLAIDKPAGLAVHGGSGISLGVIEMLRQLLPDDTLELVHRLDRDTSGCLLIARKRSALRILHALLREGLFEKRYLALVHSHWNWGHKRIDAPLRTDIRVGGERTVKVSEFRPVQFFGKLATLLEVRLHTGRTHQIRVHAAHAGHPVVGDAKYGNEELDERFFRRGLRRMFLHAHSIGFDWPQGGTFSVNAPLPVDLAQMIDRLT
jgi:23S rRNA pseudouridine955/2504/2580 synthase